MGHRETWEHSTELKLEEGEWDRNWGKTGLRKEVHHSRPERSSALEVVNEPTSSKLPAQGRSRDVRLGRSETTGPSMQTHGHGREDSRAGSQAPNTSSGSNHSLTSREASWSQEKACHPSNPSWFAKERRCVKDWIERECFKICKLFHSQTVNNV